MPETTQAADFDATLHFLQQDLASADMALAINYIEQWENHLQGTPLFQDLMELKQAILNGNLTELESRLQKVGQDTAATASQIRDEGAAEIATKVEQIGQLLLQASRNTQ